MGRPRRGSAPLVAGAVILASALVATPAAAGAPAQKLKISRACTFVLAKKVKQLFGKPIAIGENPFLRGLDCQIGVGADPDQPPGGHLSAGQVFPSFDASSARSAVEDHHAIDVLAGNQLEDVDGLGKSAYLNRTIGRLVVLVSKKFAFSLQWTRSGATSLSNADVKKLVSLAKNVIARTPS